jgi:type I restriction enzyme S subunit
MKLQTFFEKFELFADAPDSIARMRELVLELAVRGKLTDRVDDDQQEKRWRAFVSGLDVNSDDAELPFAIPGSWRWTRLHDLGDTKPRNDVADSAKVGFVPMTFIPAEYGQVAKSEERAWGDIKKGYTHFADGDVVMAKITPCFENGKSCIMNDLVNGLGAGTTELHVFRKTNDVVESRYVLIYLKSRGFIERGIPRMTGSAGQKRVPHDYFSESPFPLPPPAEQKRIVAKVDESMALCDQLEAQQQERQAKHTALARASLARFADAPTTTNLNFLFHNSYSISPADLRKFIYQAAFDGVLTARSGVAILRNDLPAGWVVRDIASMCVIEDGDRGSAYPKKSDFSETGHCVFLSTRNVRRHGFDFTSKECISEKKHQELRKGTLIRGDVIFTSRGTIGNVAHYDESVPFDVMRINSGMFILRGFQLHLNAKFLSRLLRSPQIRTQIDNLQSGSAQPQLPIREFRKFTAKIPPLAEQRRIVAKVNQLMALVDQLEAQLTAARSTAERLTAAIVAELTQVTNAA